MSNLALRLITSVNIYRTALGLIKAVKIEMVSHKYIWKV